VVIKDHGDAGDPIRQCVSMLADFGRRRMVFPRREFFGFLKGAADI